MHSVGSTLRYGCEKGRSSRWSKRMYLLWPFFPPDVLAVEVCRHFMATGDSPETLCIAVCQRLCREPMGQLLEQFVGSTQDALS